MVSNSDVSIKYANWCAKQTKLQDWWCSGYFKGRYGISSNIHIGDRFGFPDGKAELPFKSTGYRSSKGCVAVGFIVNKVIIAEEPSWISYTIAGNIGGHSQFKSHKELTEGILIWLPTIEQLFNFPEYQEQAIQFLSSTLITK